MCLWNPNIIQKIRKKQFKEIQRFSCLDRDELKERMGLAKGPKSKLFLQKELCQNYCNKKLSLSSHWWVGHHESDIYKLKKINFIQLFISDWLYKISLEFQEICITTCSGEALLIFFQAFYFVFFNEKAIFAGCAAN